MITVLETRHTKKTRKPFECDGCGRSFPAGSPKDRQRNVGEDGPYTWQSCLTCSAISRELYQIDFDGVTPDDLLEDMQTRFGSWEEADKHFAATSPVKDEPL